MNNIGICLSTKDRVELSRQSILPLLQPTKFDLWIVDGSTTEEGKAFPYEVHKGHSPLKVIENVRGGADAAIVHNLTHLLSFPHYEYVGLVENDVLLDPDWYEQTMALFWNESFLVGAVSSRCYEDRILIQRDGYAIMHNLGAGMVIFQRNAAKLVLQHYRTTFTTENRLTFAQMSGLDIARWWAFRGSPHWLCADWGFDKLLAQHGYASLALTPSRCQMLGQVPPLAEQGLTLVQDEVFARRSQWAFERYQAGLADIAAGEVTLPSYAVDHTLFAHQVASLGAVFSPDTWKLNWFQGFGPFGWEATTGEAEITIPVFGPCDVYLGGTGGAQVNNPESGFDAPVYIVAGVKSMGAFFVPSGMSCYNLRIRMQPGAIFYGIKPHYPQRHLTSFHFDHSMLPPAE